MPKLDRKNVFLRLALQIIHVKYNMTWGEIALICGIPATQLRNFMTPRNSSTEVSEAVFQYIKNFPFKKEIDECYVLMNLDEHSNALELIEQLYPLSLRGFLGEPDIIFERRARKYVGDYLVYRRSYEDNNITISYLQVRIGEEFGGLPHYVIRQKTRNSLYIVGRGIVIASSKNVYFVGHKGETNMEMAILYDPGPSFSFLHGVALTTTGMGVIFSANVYCEIIDSNHAANEENIDRFIGVFPYNEIFSDDMNKFQKNLHDREQIARYISNDIGRNNHHVLVAQL